MQGLKDILKRLRSVHGLAAYSLRRFLEDGGAGVAAALSYTSLLALVPLLAIMFAVMSIFDGFDGLQQTIQNELVSSMLPEMASTINEHLSIFVDNARQMTGAGIVGLAITAVLLLNTIYEAFNQIWRVRDTRTVAIRVLVYWALLTVGPILIGTSLSISGYAFAVVQSAGIEDYARPLINLTVLIPFLLAAVCFTLLFFLVPARTVLLRDALTGAIIAALAFEALKKGFGLYLEHFPSYQAIYGALAVLPVFLLWMYLSWAVLLFGAEIVAALPEWRATGGNRNQSQGPGAKLALALALLLRLRDAAKSGRPLRKSAMSQGLPVLPSAMEEVISALKAKGFVVHSSGGGWVLSQDLASATLNDLLVALDLSLDLGEGWPETVVGPVALISEAGAKVGQITLAEALDRAASDPPLRFGQLA